MTAKQQLMPPPPLPPTNDNNSNGNVMMTTTTATTKKNKNNNNGNAHVDHDLSHLKTLRLLMQRRKFSHRKATNAGCAGGATKSYRNLIEATCIRRRRCSRTGTIIKIECFIN